MLADNRIINCGSFAYDVVANIDFVNEQISNLRYLCWLSLDVIPTTARLITTERYFISVVSCVIDKILIPKSFNATASRPQNQ